MKIAYLFHGHSRTWKDCYQSFFDNVYSVAPGDIYIHTWDKVNTHLGSWWNGWNDLQGKNLDISNQTVDLDAIKAAYKPKHLIIETDRGLEIPLIECPETAKKNANSAHIAVYNMFKSQYNSFNLATLSGDYDIYFSCRLDLLFTNKLNIEELSQSEYMMVTPTSYNFVFDLYAFGSKNIMDIRSKFYFNICNYWYSKSDFPNYFIELAVTDYYRDNQIKVKNSGLNCEIKRLF